MKQKLTWIQKSQLVESILTETHATVGIDVSHTHIRHLMHRWSCYWMANLASHHRSAIVQFWSEQEVRRNRSESCDGEQEHSACDPSGSMTAAREICQKERRADLADLAEVEQQRNRSGFNMKEFFKRRNDAHEVGEVTALKDIGEQENHHEEVGRCEALRPSRLGSFYCFISQLQLPLFVPGERIILRHFIVAIRLHVHFVFVAIVIQSIPVMSVVKVAYHSLLWASSVPTESVGRVMCWIAIIIRRSIQQTHLHLRKLTAIRLVVCKKRELRTFINSVQVSWADLICIVKMEIGCKIIPMLLSHILLQRSLKVSN